MDKLTVRRKLLRGSLSAPVVLTVSSASAQAVTSLGQCIARNAGVQPTNKVFGPPDTWFRDPTQYKAKQITGSLPAISGWYILNAVTQNVWTKADKSTQYAASAFPPSGYTVVAEQTWYALVWFDPTTGNRVAMGWESHQNALAATLSCQLSFG